MKDADETRFEFGENWASYAHLVDDNKISAAKAGLLKLIDEEQISGASFLDIGCGSGVHALAAAQLGVRQIYGIDLDINSVETAQALFQRFRPDVPWSFEQKSVFDLDPTNEGTFETVYSWGVLHHTGDVQRAIQAAARMVSDQGLFAFSIYRPTSTDWLWKREKRWYARARPGPQKAARHVYTGLFRMASFLTGKRGSVDVRGMDYHHDLHDWLGGYPYQPLSAAQVGALMHTLKFEEVRSFTRPGGLGIFGSGCDEYIYRRI